MKTYWHNGVEVKKVQNLGRKMVVLKNGLEITVPIADLQIKHTKSPQTNKNWVKRFGSETRVKQIKMCGCVVCGRIPSENAHVKARSLGGTWQDIVPLCNRHHRELDTVLGLTKFQKRYRINLHGLAAEYANKYPVP